MVKQVDIRASEPRSRFVQLRNQFAFRITRVCEKVKYLTKAQVLLCKVVRGKKFAVRLMRPTQPISPAGSKKACTQGFSDARLSDWQALAVNRNKTIRQFRNGHVGIRIRGLTRTFPNCSPVAEKHSSGDVTCNREALLG